MKFIFDIIKGIFIGIANIIPGVSGGTMAVSMGVYDKLINSINSIIKDFKKSFLTLLPLVIPYSLSHYAFQTCMCFTGLIVGGIPQIIGNASDALKKEERKMRFTHVIAFVILAALAVIMAVANGNNSGPSVITVDFKNIVILVAIGIVAAATMIVPGVSGSLVLMILGYYSGIIGTIRDFISSLKNLNWSGLGHCIAVLVPFAIGCIVGILLISKLISWLFKKFESVTYCAILGLIAASPFAIFYKMEKCTFSAVNIIVGIILFAVACAFTYLFSKKTNSAN